MTTVAQDTKATNSLAQTFNCTYSSGPTEGRLLAALLFHDETMADISDLTSSGWTKVATTVTDLGGFDYRISLFLKFAGASESQTVSFDLGEVNRRAHGYAVEFIDAPLTLIPGGASPISTGTEASGTSNQVDDLFDVASVQFALAMVGLNGTSATPPTWGADPPTFIDNWSNNFRGSAVGFIDGPVQDLQPAASWGSGRASFHVVFVLGVAPDPLMIKARSSFQIIKA